MIPLYRPVKIVLGAIFAFAAWGLTFVDGKWIVGLICGLTSFLMFRSAYYHGKYEPPLFKRDVLRMPSSVTMNETTKFVLSKIIACGLLYLGLSLVWLGFDPRTPNRFIAIGLGLALSLPGAVILLVKRNGKFLWQMRDRN